MSLGNLLNISEDGASYKNNRKGFERASNTRKLHVSRIPLEIDETKFKELFSECGHLLFIKLYSRDGKARFSNDQGTLKAFEMYNRTPPYSMIVQYDRNDTDRKQNNSSKVYDTMRAATAVVINDDRPNPKSFKNLILTKKIIRKEECNGDELEMAITRGITASWEEGSKLSLIYSCSDSPGQFWAADNSKPILRDVLRSINDAYRKRAPEIPSNLVVGQAVAAKQDNDENYWYRAILLEKLKNKWLVQDLDYGDKNIVDTVGVLPMSCYQHPALAVSFTVQNTSYHDWVKTLNSKCTLTLSVVSTDNFTKIVDVENGHICQAVSIRNLDLKCGKHLPKPTNYKLDLNTVMSKHIKIPSREFKLGQKWSILPICYNSADGLHVRITNEENDKAVELLSKDMNTECQKRHTMGRSNLTKLSISQFVCAKWEADGNWYRSEILEIGLTDSVQVRFIDYGDRYYVKTTDLLEIPEEFCSFPPLCVLVTLKGIDDVHLEKAFNIFDTNRTWSMIVVNDGSLPLEVLMYSLDGTALLDLLQELLAASKEEKHAALETDSDDSLTKSLKVGNSKANVSTELLAKEHEDKWNLLPEIVEKIEFKAVEDNSEVSDDSGNEVVDYITSSNETVILAPGFKKISQYTNLFKIGRTKLSCREIVKSCCCSLRCDSKYFYESTPTSRLPIGKTVDVIFTEAYSPYYMYCWDSDVAANLNNLSEMMNAAIESNPNRKELGYYIPENDEICAVKSEDGVWYRAACLETMAKECRFVSIDFGYESAVSYTDIQPIQKSFMEMPAQAIFCQINDIPDEHFEVGDVEIFRNIILTGDSIKVYVVGSTLNDCSYSITIPSLKKSDFLPSAKTK